MIAGQPGTGKTAIAMGRSQLLAFLCVILSVSECLYHS